MLCRGYEGAVDITPLPVLYGFYCRDENVECISLLPLLPSKDKNDSDRFLQWTFCRLRGGGGGRKGKMQEVMRCWTYMYQWMWWWALWDTCGRDPNIRAMLMLCSQYSISGNTLLCIVTVCVCVCVCVTKGWWLGVNDKSHTRVISTLWL